MANQYADQIEAAYDGFSTAHPYASAAPAVDGIVVSRAVRMCGAIALETASSTAVVKIYNGQNATDGELVAALSLAANGKDSVFMGDRGVLCENGIYIDVASGAVVLSLWLRDWLGDRAI